MKLKRRKPNSAPVKKRWDAIIERLPKDRQLIGAEIGVWTGKTSKMLLAALPRLTLIMVDRWTPPPPGDSYHVGSTMMAKVDARGYQDAYREAMSKIRPWRERAKVISMLSVEAAAKIKDGTLDFVFIDGDHSYAGVTADLQAWAPKVKPGGLLCGHDWDNDNTTQEVRRAVTDFLGDAIHKVELSYNNTWFFRVGK
jgi:hypothetical protein